MPLHQMQFLVASVWKPEKGSDLIKHLPPIVDQDGWKKILHTAAIITRCIYIATVSGDLRETLRIFFHFLLSEACEAD